MQVSTARGAPWYAPWRQSALEHAQKAYKAAQTQARDMASAAHALILDEVEKAAKETEKRLKNAHAERIELQMLNPDGSRPVPKTGTRPVKKPSKSHEGRQS